MNGQYCVDANIFISAWEKDYPFSVFPTLWRELSEHRTDIILIRPIFDEIDPISSSDQQKLSQDQKKAKYPLRMWLIGNDFSATAIDGKLERHSLSLEKKYEISSESKGASQNDIRLVAYAAINQRTVVTLESKQQQIPDRKSNYKIPLICNKENVECIDFIGLLKRCDIRV